MRRSGRLKAIPTRWEKPRFTASAFFLGLTGCENGILVAPSLLTEPSSSLSCGVSPTSESPVLFRQRGPGFFVNNQPSVPRIADVLGRKDAEEKRAEREWARERELMEARRFMREHATKVASEQKNVSKKRKRGFKYMAEQAFRDGWRNQTWRTRSF